MVARLKDPAVRAQGARRDARDGTRRTGRISISQAGADGMLMLSASRQPALKPLIGKTLAEIAQKRGVSAPRTRSSIS